MHAQEHSKNFRILYSVLTLIRVLHRSIIKGVSSLAFDTNNHEAQSILFHLNQKFAPRTNNNRNCNSPKENDAESINSRLEDMYNSLSWFRFQHPQTQWNLRGGG
jgi:hypothetical protein